MAIIRKLPSISGNEEMTQIIEQRFDSNELSGFSKLLLEYIQWMANKQRAKQTLSLRDILTWIDFMNAGVNKLKMNSHVVYTHSLCMILLDGLGIGSGLTSSLKILHEECFSKLLEQIPEEVRLVFSGVKQNIIHHDQYSFGIKPFFISKGTTGSSQVSYALEATHNLK